MFGDGFARLPLSRLSYQMLSSGWSSPHVYSAATPRFIGSLLPLPRGDQIPEHELRISFLLGAVFAQAKAILLYPTFLLAIIAWRGEYEIVVGMYDPESGERLLIVDKGGVMIGNRVLLGMVKVVDE